LFIKQLSFSFIIGFKANLSEIWLEPLAQKNRTQKRTVLYNILWF